LARTAEEYNELSVDDKAALREQGEWMRMNKKGRLPANAKQERSELSAGRQGQLMLLDSADPPGQQIVPHTSDFGGSLESHILAVAQTAKLEVQASAKQEVLCPVSVCEEGKYTAASKGSHLHVEQQQSSNIVPYRRILYTTGKASHTNGVTTELHAGMQPHMRPTQHVSCMSARTFASHVCT
jgi:hypothetical protein